MDLKKPSQKNANSEDNPHLDNRIFGNFFAPQFGSRTLAQMLRRRITLAAQTTDCRIMNSEGIFQLDWTWKMSIWKKNS